MDCTIEHLSVFDAAGRQCLREVSLVAAAGQLLAIAGPPGSGKSTLLRVLAGNLPKDWRREGTVDFAAEPATGAAAGYRLPPIRHVGPERELLPKPKVRNLLRTRGRLALPDDRAVDRWLDRLLGYFPHLATRLDQVIANLSDGEKRLLGLYVEVAGRPRLLAIDRPADGVSPLSLPELFAGLRAYARENQAIVVCVEENSAHLLRAADRIAVLERGRLVFTGAPDELRADAETLRRLGFGQPRQRFARPRRGRPADAQGPTG